MPYAQCHYPFENKERFESHFPADFIAEGLDQTRGWFYTLLILADVLVVLEVYAAGEDPIAGADGRAIARAVRSRGGVEPVFVESLTDLPQVLGGLLEDGDLLLTMGAGDIGAAARELPDRLRHGPNLRVQK